MKTSGGILKHQIVLLGAGNAHVQLVRKWAMSPIPRTELTLVNETGTVPYSAMIPGYIAGQYSRAETEIDLTALCGVAGVRFLRAKFEGLDPKARTIALADRPAIGYEYASLNLGSIPAIPPGEGPAELSIPVKPLHLLMHRLDALGERLESRRGESRLVVVGSGAGGTELALAIRQKFRRHEKLRVLVLEASDRILPSGPTRAARLFGDLFQERGIEVRAGARVERFDAEHLYLADGEKIPIDAVLWTTRAAPGPALERLRLKTDKRGFLLVNDSLQTLGDPNLFGAGDCVSLQSYPDLAKSGVYAVREGPLLWENLNRVVAGRPLRKYRPQKRFLTILNCSDGTAVLNYDGIAIRSRASWRLKRWIDARWMAKFQNLDRLRMEPSEDAPMRCGGCGSKISSTVLHNVLSRLRVPRHEAMIVGLDEAEDAAVWRPPSTHVEVHSVDFFRAFLNDPYLFGQIAVQNALSDLYAMNAAPTFAQAIVTLPNARPAIQEDLLFQILSGSLLTLQAAGATLAGGHTSEAGELMIGFAVTGVAEMQKLFRKNALRTNQKLILTKPLGSGALLAALMQGSCRADWFEEMIRWQLKPNAEAARIFSDADVTACTDVTGFGLAGHLLEMCRASGRGARLYPNDLPLLPGFRKVTAEKIFSTLHAENERFSAQVATTGPMPELYDPQTSGGLLAGVPPDAAFEIVRSLHAAGYESAAIIGEVIETKRELIHC